MDNRILPPEIIADVLSRLSVKSLCRFKCVSPSWNSLISSPHFSKTHLDRTHANNPKGLLRNIIVVLLYGSRDLYSVDLTDSAPAVVKLDLPVKAWVWNSCNGLVLVSDFGKSNLFLLNLSTRECKKLPELPLPYALGVGYDSSTDDYKVVMLSYDGFGSGSGSESESDSVSERSSDVAFVAVYSLKTDAWRRVQDAHYFVDESMSVVYCSGRLHWLCWRADSFLMVAFDWVDEVLMEVPLPALLIYSNQLMDLDVVVIGGCLCLVYEQGGDPGEVWIMKEYGIRASWTKILVYNHDMHVLGLLAEDEFLLIGNMVPTGKEDKLVVYNPKKGTQRDVVVCGIPALFSPWGTYVESLDSPNQCSHGGGIVKQEPR